MKLFKQLLLIILPLTILGCKTTETISKNDAFPEMYNEKPVSLLIVPLINNTTAADAPDLYYTTLKKPLSELGYYVLPIHFTQQVMREQGIIDGQLAKKVPLDKYKKIFGADAVLFITVNAWDTNYMVVSSNMVVSSEFSLYSTTTESRLWRYNNSVTYDLTGNSGNLLADVISTALSTAVTDYVPIAEQVNRNVLSTLPAGHYSPRHGKDGIDKFYGVFIPLASHSENVDAKKFSAPKSGYSNLYIYRKASSSAMLQGSKKSLWIDNECIGNTASNSFIKISVKTGAEYLLTTESEMSPNLLTIKVMEDGNYFYEQLVRPGMMAAMATLKEVEEKQAILDIDSLSLASKSPCNPL